MQAHVTNCTPKTTPINARYRIPNQTLGPITHNNKRNQPERTAVRLPITMASHTEPRPHPLHWIGSGDIRLHFRPYAISTFWPIRRFDSATTRFDNEDGQLKQWFHKHNKMAEGPKNVVNVTRPYSTKWVGSGNETRLVTACHAMALFRMFMLRDGTV